MYYFIIAGFVLAVISYWLFLHLSTPDTVQGKTGTLALGVVRASQLAERISLYIGSAALLAADRALLDTAAAGGFASEPACGPFFGYPVWSRPCIGDAPAAFASRFNDHLAPLLSAEHYPEQAKTIPLDEQIFEELLAFFPELPTSEYRLFARGHELAGSNSEPLRVNIHFGKPVPGQGRGEVGEYRVRSDFHVTTSADLDQLYDFQAHAEALADPGFLSQFAPSSGSDIQAVLDNPGWESSLDWKAGACAPENAEELFWDVAERVQDCMQVDPTLAGVSCRCDLSGTDLSLLDEHYEIVLSERGFERFIELRETESKSVVHRYSFEDSVPFGFHDPKSPFAIESLAEAAGVVLRWDGENIVKRDDFTGASGGIRAAGGMFRQKGFGKDILTFIPDDSRTPQYEQFAFCEPPEKEMLRLCATGGNVPWYDETAREVVERPVRFRLAIDLRSSAIINNFWTIV